MYLCRYLLLNNSSEKYKFNFKRFGRIKVFVHFFFAHHARRRNWMEEAFSLTSKHVSFASWIDPCRMPEDDEGESNPIYPLKRVVAFHKNIASSLSDRGRLPQEKVGIPVVSPRSINKGLGSHFIASQPSSCTNWGPFRPHNKICQKTNSISFLWYFPLLKCVLLFS